MPVISLLSFENIVVPQIHKKWERDTLEPQKARYYSQVHQLINDLKDLSPRLQLLNTPANQDAGPFLNRRLPWFMQTPKDLRPDKSQGGQHQSGPPESTLLSQPLPGTPIRDQIFLDLISKEKLSGASVDISSLQAEDFAQIDTAWLKKIRQYDHWAIDRSPPLSEEARFSIVESPSLDFLPQLMLVHIIKAKDQSGPELVAALQDVLHYGQLAFSTETLMGQLTLVIALRYVDGLTRGAPHLRSALGEWEPLLSEAQKLQKIFLATQHFVRIGPLTSIERFREMYMQTNFSTGLCGALRENFGLGWPLLSLHRDASPESLMEVRSLIQSHSRSCRLDWAQKKISPWEKHPSEKDFFESGNAVEMLNAQASSRYKWLNYALRGVQYLPNTRKFISTLILAVGTPQLNPYEEVN